MSESSESIHKLSCTTRTCEEEAVIYCLTCKQLFCGSHHEVHEGFVKLLLTPHDVMSCEEYFAETEEKRYCANHARSPIVLACEKCYHVMCAKCMDHAETEATQCHDEEKHKTRSIEQVAAKIHDEVTDLLSQLRARELVNADDMKEQQKIFDDQSEANRLDLDKLAVKIGELHKMLDDFAKDTKKSLVKHMTEKKEMMQKWEKEFTDYQQACTQAHNETSRIMKMNNEAFVKDQKRIKESLSPLITFKIEQSPLNMTQMSLVLKDEKVNLPISLRETSRVPTSIVYKEAKNTPTGNAIYAVQYIKDGQLLDAGNTYQVNGLNYTPQIPSGSGRINHSLFEHKSSLYVLQWCNNNYYIHVSNLLNQTDRQSVITYPSSAAHSDLVVNDEYIITPDNQSKSLKVYSTKTPHGLQFDMKHECISNYPWGVAFLKNTIVVGDHNRHQVSNITVNASPELRWTCDGIQTPTAIQVCENSRIILVASNSQKQIHGLSYEGERLATLDVPQCSRIYDMTIYENRLAIADTSAGVKIYEIKTDTE